MQDRLLRIWGWSGLPVWVTWSASACFWLHIIYLSDGGKKLVRYVSKSSILQDEFISDLNLTCLNSTFTGVVWFGISCDHPCFYI